MAEQNMLLFLIACLELDLALFNLLLVSHRRRTILMRDIAFSRTSYRRFGSNTRLARARRFWIRPGRTSAWWDNFVSQTVVPEEWKENFRMSQPSLLKLSEELRPYIRVSEDSRKHYENGSVQARRQGGCVGCDRTPPPTGRKGPPEKNLLG